MLQLVAVRLVLCLVCLLWWGCVLGVIFCFVLFSCVCLVLISWVPVLLIGLLFADGLVYYLGFYLDVNVATLLLVIVSGLLCWVTWAFVLFDLTVLLYF